MYYSPMLVYIKILSRTYTRKKTNIFNMRKFSTYGEKINQFLKGGKSMNMTNKSLKKKVLNKKIAIGKNDKTITIEK